MIPVGIFSNHNFPGQSTKKDVSSINTNQIPKGKYLREQNF